MVSDSFVVVAQAGQDILAETQLPQLWLRNFSSNIWLSFAD